MTEVGIRIGGKTISIGNKKPSKMRGLKYFEFIVNMDKMAMWTKNGWCEFNSPKAPSHYSQTSHKSQFRLFPVQTSPLIYFFIIVIF